jgi:hypothetical protein
MAAITLGASSGAAGSQVTIAGTGFGGGETVVLTVRGQYAGVFPTEQDGSFDGIAFIPEDLPAAATTIAATGNTSTTTASSAFTVS